MGYHNFYHVALNESSLTQSVKTKLHFKMKSKLLDYKQVDKNQIAILSDQMLFVIDPESKTELLAVKLPYKQDRILALP